MDYESAEERGFFKFDLLNVHVYEQVKDEAHLQRLMDTEPPWELFLHDEFVSQLIHLGRHGELVRDLKPTCIEHVAMILALIRPGKRHLIDRCRRYGFDSISGEIWTPTADAYYFKHSHAVSYAMLVFVHANLLVEQLT